MRMWTFISSLALGVAALPLSAQAAIITYSGSGPGTGSSLDSISGHTTQLIGNGSFSLIFDSGNLCQFGETQCSFAGDTFTATTSASHAPTITVQLKFDHVLGGFPLSAAGFLEGSLAYEYGGLATYETSQTNITGLTVSVVDGSGPVFAELTAQGPSQPVAVPEPESWTMMIAGLGLAGAAIRKGRRKAILRHA